MKILLFKKTTDDDLKIGLKVCYHDQNGVYSKFGKITDYYECDGVLNYLVNTSFGAYVAEELKLLKSIN